MLSKIMDWLDDFNGNGELGKFKKKVKVLSLQSLNYSWIQKINWNMT